MRHQIISLSDIIMKEDKIQYCMDIVAGTRQLEVAGFTGDIYNTWKTTYYKMVDTVSSYTQDIVVGHYYMF